MSKYDFSNIEKKWQEKWLKDKTYEPDLDKAKKPFYNLMMFPYPSAEGLHVGNMYAFTGSDIYGRFKRMQGYDVFEPIGLDGFGIHSENYAIRAGKHPIEITKAAQENFYRQLQELGNGFAWDEKLETYDPAYYKWTQWIFVQMFKHGLAYRKKQSVNWCPSCKTVLADEQVVGAAPAGGEPRPVAGRGECERCLTKVEKRELEQWFFKITDYADRLLNDLEKLNWSEKVKIAQRNWIGKSEGALIKFPLTDIPGQPDGKHSVEVFTTRPDTIFGATFVAISPELAKQWVAVGWRAEEYVKTYIEKTLAERVKEKGAGEVEKTGVNAGINAVNPATNEELPVWVVNYVLGDVGTGAIMAVPAHDERDREFAEKFKLPLGNGQLVSTEEVLKKTGGVKTIQYHLRDWLISRQRYWGPPIPMIYCETCASVEKGERKDMPGWYVVPEKDLPVTLPRVEDFRPKGTGVSPLASVKEFYEVKCPGCGGAARRETDVSDTFLDSAWYYLRYVDSKNDRAVFSKDRVKRWLPVDMYIGGAEHAVLHLLYVRFMAKVFHDWKLVDFDEPAKQFCAHGLLIRNGKKISKSKGNIVNPDEFVKKHGADALRLHLMFLGPFEDGGDFRDEGIMGPVRFLERVWRLFHAGTDPDSRRRKESGSASTYIAPDSFKRLLHKTVKKVGEDIESINYNTAISALMILLNEAENQSKSADLPRYFEETFLKLLAPFAPHMTEELWEKLGHTISIHKEPWPEYDEKLIREETFTLVIQVNGKARDVVEARAGISQAEAEKLVLGREKIKALLGTGKPKKIVFVPGRLINVVV